MAGDLGYSQEAATAKGKKAHPRMTVVWTSQALSDLVQIREHIERDSKAAAARVSARLRSSAKRLALYPESGRVGKVDSTRELVVAGTQYILPYRVRRGEVQILAVLHGAQEWPEDF